LWETGSDYFCILRPMAKEGSRDEAYLRQATDYYPLDT